MRLISWITLLAWLDGFLYQLMLVTFVQLLAQFSSFISVIIDSFATGLTESLFSSHKDEYPEHEQASLRQLYQAKVCVFMFYSPPVNSTEHLFLWRQWTVPWFADGRTVCWEPAAFWINWDYWALKRGFCSIFPPADICYCCDRICAMEWGSNIKMHFVFISGNF